MLRVLLRNSGCRHRGIAISDSLEKAGNWDAGHLNYAFLADEDESRKLKLSGGYERGEEEREKLFLHKMRCMNRYNFATCSSRNVWDLWHVDVFPPIIKHLIQSLSAALLFIK